jgi:hypothetical protein
MFSLREYLTNIFTLPCGSVDELAVNDAIQSVATACQTWGRNMRLKEVVMQMAI